ncbi:hypothetical protein B0H13DRAFT_1011278 [Mycena leptocephala]|nr:hypothetical protein B0H13DRAFT_1011278 [Mycena leptocephala]
MEMLDGREGDYHILELIEGLLKASDVSALCVSLIQKSLQRLSNIGPHDRLRKSYTDLIMKLPCSFSFSSDDTDKLVVLLRSPNITVSQSAMSIVKHFAANAQFQQDILKTDVWVVLLRRQDTAAMVPEILAKFREFREIRVNSASGIILELLNMFDAGPIYFDRWQIGLKGLLALGVFQ